MENVSGFGGKKKKKKAPEAHPKRYEQELPSTAPILDNIPSTEQHVPNTAPILGSSLKQIYSTLLPCNEL